MNTKNTTQFAQEVEIPLPLEVHPSVSQKAAELLLGVIEVLMRKPEMYNQMGTHQMECGTPCCIIGHMRVLSGDRFADRHKKLGLSVNQCESLFHATKWPEQFKPSHGDVSYSTICERIPASVGIARIEHFLRTGE